MLRLHAPLVHLPHAWPDLNLREDADADADSAAALLRHPAPTHSPSPPTPAHAPPLSRSARRLRSRSGPTDLWDPHGVFTARPDPMVKQYLRLAIMSAPMFVKARSSTRSCRERTGRRAAATIKKRRQPEDDEAGPPTPRTMILEVGIVDGKCRLLYETQRAFFHAESPSCERDEHPRARRGTVAVLAPWNLGKSVHAWYDDRQVYIDSVLQLVGPNVNEKPAVFQCTSRRVQRPFTVRAGQVQARDGKWTVSRSSSTPRAPARVSCSSEAGTSSARDSRIRAAYASALSTPAGAPNIAVMHARDRGLHISARPRVCPGETPEYHAAHLRMLRVFG